MKKNKWVTGLGLVILVSFFGGELAHATQIKNSKQLGSKASQSARKAASKRLKKIHQKKQHQKMQNWLYAHMGYTGLGKTGDFGKHQNPALLKNVIRGAK